MFADLPVILSPQGQVLAAETEFHVARFEFAVARDACLLTAEASMYLLQQTLPHPPFTDSLGIEWEWREGGWRTVALPGEEDDPPAR